MKRKGTRDFYRPASVLKSKYQKEEIRFLNRLRTIAERQQFEDIYTRVGYEILGPILYGYCLWLHKQVEEEKPDTIVFLSREGRILETAYKTIFPESEGEPTLHYINVSRLSLSKATFLNIQSWRELEDRYATLFRGLTYVNELAKLLDIIVSADDYKSAGIDEFCEIGDVKDKEALFQLFREKGKSNFKDQKELAIKYLKIHGLGKGKTIISDIGWSGTMQILLKDLFPNDYFIGCYLAVSDIYKHIDYKRIDRRGFIADENNVEYWNTVRFTQSFFEYMFLCDEGTTIAYRDVQGRVEAIKREENKKSREQIKKSHDAAISFINDIKKRTSEKDADISWSRIALDCKNWVTPYINFAVTPGLDTLQFCSNVTFINASKEYGFLPEYRLGYYLFHPKEAIRELNLSGCKVIWLYGLLRLPIPYFKILCFMTEKLGMKSKYEKRYLKGNKGIRHGEAKIQ